MELTFKDGSYLIPSRGGYHDIVISMYISRTMHKELLSDTKACQWNNHIPVSFWEGDLNSGHNQYFSQTRLVKLMQKEWVRLKLQIQQKEKPTSSIESRSTYALLRDNTWFNIINEMSLWYEILLKVIEFGFVCHNM